METLLIMTKEIMFKKILAFEPVMNMIGFGAIWTQFKTGFLNDPKSWVLIGSLVLLNLSKSYKNFKDANIKDDRSEEK